MRSHFGWSVLLLSLSLAACGGSSRGRSTRDGGPGGGDGSVHHMCNGTDTDHDGISDDQEGGAAADADADGTPNVGDSDDDGDGLPDSSEAGADPCAPADHD